METATRVAYLGPEGTFSEQAVRRQFGDSVEAQALASIDDVFRAAEFVDAVQCGDLVPRISNPSPAHWIFTALPMVRPGA